MEWVILAVVLAVVLVVAVAGFVVPRRRGTTLPPAPEKAVPPLGVDAEAAETAVLTEPEARPGAGTEPEPRPGEGTLVDTTGPGLEVPEAAAGRMMRLRSRLSRSQSTLGRGLLSLLSREDLDEDAWEDVEDTLLSADVGVAATQEIVERLQTRTKVLGTRSEGELRALLADELVTALQPDMDRTLHTVPHADGHPAVLLVVGVNGTGKTTTCGKIARLLVADGRTVLLAAADTFRAAAADQLETWASRVGARVVRGPEGGDPASVAFEAVKLGTETDDTIGVDTVVVDTAGRLHTKVGLMDELGKVKRVVEKQGPVDETLLVLDATTGQNGVVQARVFTEAVDVTGIVLTKLDGTAKGGIVVAVQRELGVPVKLVGLGEGPDDLAPFEPETFVDALLGETA